MKVQIRIMHEGMTYMGEASLAEIAPDGRVPKQSAVANEPPSPNKPAGAVDRLYAVGFFSSERPLGEVMAELGKTGYNFSSPSIFMALKSRRYLHRRGAKGSYRFVQRFPPAQA